MDFNTKGSGLRYPFSSQGKKEDQMSKSGIIFNDKTDLYKKRLKRFREKMDQAGTEAVIVLKPENLAYLSGFDGSSGILLLTRTSVKLLVDFRYLEQAKDQAQNFDIVQIGQPLSETLRRIFLELHLETVSFEQDYVTWEQYEIWINKLGDVVEFIPLSDLTLKLRMLKDSEELECIKEAVKVADSAFLEILPMLRPGNREREIAVELEYAMRRRGAQRTAFETIVASGPRSSLPHGTATERIIQTGDLVIVDFGAVSRGYCSDCTRTVSIGPPTSKQREIYDVVQRAQDAALDSIRPGVPTSEVDKVARDLISRYGYGENFGHSLGHGVGRLVHEEPSLAAKDQTLLEPGMVVTVEPGIYLPGWGGVRIEELVLVTASGCEILTRCIKGLTML
jgi:Xaa-Pro aminopeptidase